MRFFEHQSQARSATKRMLVLFAVSVFVVAACASAGVSLVLLWMSSSLMFGSAAWLKISLVVFVITSLTICLSSLYKVLSLRGGGDVVAQQSGGTLVPTSTQDPNLRRLRNVVEEMAIASRTPVPSIYVLENEQSINAFAAGFSPHNAAIGITRGALTHLNRSELQAVIGHEFSHILNGDMRLNIVMMGVIHGLLALHIAGQFIMRHSGGSRNKDVTALVLIGGVLFFMGWIGMICGRLIKANVSRHREYLADASSVQFTRHPEGLASALKKVAGGIRGSEIDNPVAREQLSHMFFGKSFIHGGWWDTHPPIMERIKRLDPGIKPFHIEAIKKTWMSTPPNGMEEDVLLGFSAPPVILSAQKDVSSPSCDWMELVHEPLWAGHMFLLMMFERLPQECESALAQWWGINSVPSSHAAWDPSEQNNAMPLVLISLASLRQLPPHDQERFLNLVALAPEKTVLEQVLKILLMHEHFLWNNPAYRSSRQSLDQAKESVSSVLSIMAYHGSFSSEQYQQAFSRGYRFVFNQAPSLPPPTPQIKNLNPALEQLKGLSSQDRQNVVDGLYCVMMDDKKATANEQYILGLIAHILDTRPLEAS